MRQAVLLGNPDTKRTGYLGQAAEQAGLSLLFVDWRDWRRQMPDTEIFLKIDPPLWTSCSLEELEGLTGEYTEDLEEMARMGPPGRVQFLNHPMAIKALLDKRECKRRLMKAGLPVTRMLDLELQDLRPEPETQDVQSLTENNDDGRHTICKTNGPAICRKEMTAQRLLEIMEKQRVHQVFIKPVKGSGAAGVSAFRIQPAGGRMALYTCMTLHTGIESHTDIDSHTDIAPHTGIDPHTGIAPHTGIDSHTGIAPHTGIDSHTDIAPHTGIASHTGINSHTSTASYVFAQEESDSRLVNTKRLRHFTDKDEIFCLLDRILKLDCVVERWYAKAEYRGYSYDLRAVVQDGQMDFLLARLSKGPITNLHLNNAPFPVRELGLPARVLDSVTHICQKSMECYPGLRSAGIDILLEKGSLEPRIIEMNAQGDLIYQDIFKDNIIYRHQAEIFRKEII